MVVPPLPVRNGVRGTMPLSGVLLDVCSNLCRLC